MDKTPNNQSDRAIDHGGEHLHHSPHFDLHHTWFKSENSLQFHISYSELNSIATLQTTHTHRLCPKSTKNSLLFNSQRIKIQSHNGKHFGIGFSFRFRTVCMRFRGSLYCCNLPCTWLAFALSHLKNLHESLHILLWVKKYFAEWARIRSIFVQRNFKMTDGRDTFESNTKFSTLSPSLSLYLTIIFFFFSFFSKRNIKCSTKIKMQHTKFIFITTLKYTSLFSSCFSQYCFNFFLTLFVLLLFHLVQCMLICW